MKQDGTTYHALLMEYASGCLDEAHALVVATHMVLSPTARKYVAQYESIGGSILNDCCTPVAMNKDARQCVMDKLESLDRPIPSKCAMRKKITADDLAVPDCLEHYIETATWVSTPDGTQTLHVKTTCSGSKAQLKKIAAGQRMAANTGKRPDITLVLKGRLSDNSETYQRGDLIVRDDNTERLYVADTSEGCVYFVVRKSSSPLHHLLEQAISYLRKS